LRYDESTLINMPYKKVSNTHIVRTFLNKYHIQKTEVLTLSNEGTIATITLKGK